MMMMIEVEDTTLQKGGVRRGGESIPLYLNQSGRGRWMDGITTITIQPWIQGRGLEGVSQSLYNSPITKRGIH